MAASPVQDSCIFCRIARKELPAAFVYEDDAVAAFLDANPISRGHTLLIPKVHCATLLDLPDAAARAVLPALARIGRAVMAATGAGGFNCLQNNFAAAGQVVFHSHWHVIPRFEGDGLAQWPHKEQCDAAARDAVAAAIRAAL